MRPDQCLAPKVPVFVKGYRLASRKLHIDLQVILQVRPHALAVGDNLDPVFAKMLGRSDPRQHQKLGRVDRRGGDDHLAPGANDFDARPRFNLDPDGAFAFHHHLAGKTTRDLDIAARHRRFQIGIGRRPAPTFPDRRLHRTKAFLCLTVVVGRHRIARLLTCLDEGVEQWVAAGTAGNMQRPVGAPEFRTRSAVRIFHPFEIGQHVRIGPTIRPHFGPGVIVAGMPPDIDHAVDG